MNKFFAFACLAFCAVANSQVLPIGPLGGIGPLNAYHDIYNSHIGGGSSSSSASAAASAASDSSSIGHNDLLASRINSLNAWPMGLGSIGTLGALGPIGTIGLPIGHQGGSSSSSAAAAAAAASSSSAADNILNSWPVMSPLVGGINPWVGSVGPIGALGPIGPLGTVGPMGPLGSIGPYGPAGPIINPGLILA